jgi:FkbM family methyltransferase
MVPTQAHQSPPLSPESRSPLPTLTRKGRENVNGRSVPRLAVSVVVPCKNDARHLSAALESILSQDYPLLECIVVDGGSADGTIDLLKRYGDRIRWLSEPDRGPFDSINRGWQLSNGEILTWLNADDLWEPGAVRTIVDYFERWPDIDVIYGIAGIVDDLGRAHGDLVPRAWDLEYALRHCQHVIAQPASFMRRRILEQVGWLYPAWCHDHDLWLRIARAGGKFARLPVRLAMARVRPNNWGAQLENVIPAKLALTQRFFADPGLPAPVRRLRRRAISGACALAVDYVQISKPRDWLLAVRFLVRAIAADPGNSPLIGVQLWRFLRRCIKSLLSRVSRLCSKVLVRGAGISRRLARLVLPRAVAGRQQPLRLSDLRLGIHGTPPTLRRIPGWHTHWGVESPSHPFLSGRLELWSSLEDPVLMRWFADLLVAAWPGNEMSRALFLTGTYEPNELVWMSDELTKGMTVIDVGANMGLYSMIASRLVGESGHVIALEPSAREFQRLAFHVTLNDLQNIRCIQVAASDSSGDARLSIAGEWNAGHNTLGKFFDPAVVTARVEGVRTQTIDALVADLRLERVDLVKIDVEGHELKVLAGAVETLTRFRPRILIEVFEDTLHRQGASVEAVLALLEGYGYRLYEFSDLNGDVVPLLRPVGAGSRNVVAVPRGSRP